MFIWEVFKSLQVCPWKKFSLKDEGEKREYVISTDSYLGIAHPEVRQEDLELIEVVSE